MEEQLEGVWKPRLAAAADPFESSLQRERVREQPHSVQPSIFVIQSILASPWHLMKPEVARQE